MKNEKKTDYGVSFFDELEENNEVLRAEFNAISKECQGLVGLIEQNVNKFGFEKDLLFIPYELYDWFDNDGQKYSAPALNPKNIETIKGLKNQLSVFAKHTNAIIDELIAVYEREREHLEDMGIPEKMAA